MSKTSTKQLKHDIEAILPKIFSSSFDADQIWPLLQAASSSRVQDKSFWTRVATVVSNYAPVPPLDSDDKILDLRSTENFTTLLDYQKYLELKLQESAGMFHVGVAGFHEQVFGTEPRLQEAADEVFKQCSNVLFKRGWAGWSASAPPKLKWKWLAETITKLAERAASLNIGLKIRQRPLTQPNTRIQQRDKPKIDIAFVREPNAGRLSFSPWSQCLVPGQIRSCPPDENAIEVSWLDFAVLAKKVFVSQSTRRYVLAFTLFRSMMRVWQFDRLGGMVSEQFGINKEGKLFVLTMLGFLCLDNTKLGFDPTIQKINGERCIDIERNGQKERMVIFELLRRDRVISGLATTCWAAYLQSNPRNKFIVKDTWDVEDDLYPYSHPRQGESLEKVSTKQNIRDVEQYYHQYTVFIDGARDNVMQCGRRGLCITKRTSAWQMRAVYGQKDSSGQKVSPSNRVHNRVIVPYHGKHL